MVSTLVMGNRTDGTVVVRIQIIVMVNSSVELRAEEQQKHNCSQMPYNAGSQR